MRWNTICATICDLGQVGLFLLGAQQESQATPQRRAKEQ